MTDRHNIYLEVQWSDDFAEYRYTLVKYGERVEGSRAWAQKIADYYGITVPQIRKDEDNEGE